MSWKATLVLMFHRAVFPVEYDKFKNKTELRLLLKLNHGLNWALLLVCPGKEEACPASAINFVTGFQADRYAVGDADGESLYLMLDGARTIAGEAKATSLNMVAVNLNKKEEEITRRPLPLFAIDKQAGLILIDASVIVVDNLGIQTSWARVIAEPVQS